MIHGRLAPQTPLARFFTIPITTKAEIAEARERLKKDVAEKRMSLQEEQVALAVLRHAESTVTS